MGIVTIDGIPVYNAIIAGDDEGMIRISLVDSPAVMSDYQKFKEQQPLQMYSVEDEEKRLVFGVVMRADFPIYRRDERMGEYYMIFKADTIRLMAEKYLSESRQNAIDLDHDGNEVEGVQMVQWFIKDSEKGINPAGFKEEIADGSLFAEFHITDDTIWDAIKEGTYKGFSLEGYFDLEANEDKDEVQDIVDALHGLFNRVFKSKSKKKMSKLAKLKMAIAKAFAEFANISTDKGILAWDGEEDLKVGDEVYKEDEAGERTTPEDGEYTTDEGMVIVVADGKVSEIKEAEEKKEEEDEPAKEDEPAAEETAEVKAAKQKKLSFAKVKTAMEESYNDKIKKIYDALCAAGYDCYVVDAGDDFAIVDVWDDEAGDFHYLRFDISWDENGEVVLGDSIEVKPAFVPVDEPAKEDEPADDGKDEEMSQMRSEIDRLKGENATLTAQIAELKKTPAGASAHAEFLRQEAVADARVEAGVRVVSAMKRK